MKVKVSGFMKIKLLGEVSDVKPVNRFLTGLQTRMHDFQDSKAKSLPPFSISYHY